MKMGGFFFGVGCWKLAEKGGTGARQHRLLEWSNPISQQFPTRGHEPKQVLSSKTPIFPPKKNKKNPTNPPCGKPKRHLN